MKLRTIIYILCAFIFSLAILYVKIGPPPPKTTIRMILPPSIIASLPIWVAEEQQLFAKHYLNVETVNVANSRIMVETLLADNVDILPAVSLVDLVVAGAPPSGALLKALIYSHSRMRNEPAFESLLAPQGSELSTLRDLAGKKIAVYPGNTSELAVRHYLKRLNIDVTGISFVKLPPPEHSLALAAGSVHAAHVYEPFRTAMLTTGKAREISGSIYASFNEPACFGLSAISRKFVKENPEAAKRFLAVWNEAIDYIREHPKEAREILGKKLALPTRVANEATWVDATKSSENDFGTVRNTVDSMKAAGIIPNEFILEKDMVCGAD